jgi:putative ABC transport system permease protein
LLLAVAGAIAVSLGVLFGSRLYVPFLLRSAGRLVRRLNPASAIAAKNVARDPARASATVAALALAVGLIVTLQVGVASVTATIDVKAASEHPVDIVIAALDTPTGLAFVPDEVRVRLTTLANLTQVVGVDCRRVTNPAGTEPGPQAKVCRYSDELARLSEGFPPMAPNQILVGERSSFLLPGQEVHLGGTSGAVTLKAVASTTVDEGYTFVSDKTYDELVGVSTPANMVFASVSDPTKAASIVRDVNEIVTTSGTSLTVDGGVVWKAQYKETMDIVLRVVSGLLAVAVVIALVGVGNTLTLSVIERRRENAVLRALGFKRRQLRLMLLVESVLLVGVGGLVGVVAAGLSSILPGRRAAKASPVEALADA